MTAAKGLICRIHQMSVQIGRDDPRQPCRLRRPVAGRQLGGDLLGVVAADLGDFLDVVAANVVDEHRGAASCSPPDIREPVVAAGALADRGDRPAVAGQQAEKNLTVTVMCRCRSAKQLS